ncbi:uncharacterized protein BO66DRAFT_390852 [Aspergillus aculeatinus CBS 121060]|uniref:Uncharacterized protein n=1 Tax=Aspergillus aculeatinus CBS 121060 TaxID=1448322 RepID=A0ACD1HDZ9_9EURO|nr:hypothetical protein BO66DRAFT_390852 [Aspergillus aculeatinus CBS 121060]RAH71621.1 hypothetical protein BO66DRAFT_390852 [Aspergillus aculeatinus CBS 121060]
MTDRRAAAGLSVHGVSRPLAAPGIAILRSASKECFAPSELHLRGVSAGCHWSPSSWELVVFVFFSLPLALKI